MKHKTVYPPHQRTFYHPSEKDIRSYAPDGSSSPLPNPAVDPIVSNNISNVEFDYTEDMAREMD